MDMIQTHGRPLVRLAEALSHANKSRAEDDVVASVGPSADDQAVMDDMRGLLEVMGVAWSLDSFVESAASRRSGGPEASSGTSSGARPAGPRAHSMPVAQWDSIYSRSVDLMRAIRGTVCSAPIAGSGSLGAHRESVEHPGTSSAELA